MAENKENLTYHYAPSKSFFWDVNRVGMQNEYRLGALYASLPKPSEADFQEFKRLNPELADGVEKRQQMRQIQSTAAIATGVVSSVSIMAICAKGKLSIMPTLVLGGLAGIFGRVAGLGVFRDVGFWVSGADQIKFAFPHDPERAYARWWRLKNKVPLPGYTTIQPNEDIGIKL